MLRCRYHIILHLSNKKRSVVLDMKYNWKKAVKQIKASYQEILQEPSTEVNNIKIINPKNYKSSAWNTIESKYIACYSYLL